MPNRAAGVAVFSVAGAFVGATAGFVYALSSILTGPDIPMRTFVLVGAGVGAVRGVTIEVCPQKSSDE